MKNLKAIKTPKKAATVAAPSAVPLPDIGQSLRARRRQLGLSIVEVAQGSQLSNGYISLLERNLASPSITSLMRIGEVLGLPLHHFLQVPETGGHHFPRSARTPFQLARGGMRFDRVSGEFAGSVVNALVVTIPPQHKSSPIMHPGEELVYVLGGNLRFTLGGRKVLMEKGDSVHLPSTMPHAWDNPFTEEATVLWVGTAPLFQHDADMHVAGEDLKHHGSPTGIPLHQAIATRRAQKNA